MVSTKICTLVLPHCRWSGCGVLVKEDESFLNEVFPHVLAHRLRGLQRYDAKAPSGEELRHFSRSRTDVGDEMCPVSQRGLCLVQEGVEDGARVGGSDGAVSRCLDLEGVGGFHLGILSGPADKGRGRSGSGDRFSAGDQGWAVPALRC